MHREGLPLFFAKVLSQNTTDIRVEAIAITPPGTGTRFLIDDEMIDSDIPSIEQLANRLGKNKEAIISDKNGDWFIDLPPGEKLWLPTGQVGDEGLLDINVNVGTTRPHIRSATKPSHKDFLNANEGNSSWRNKLIPKSMLDPLKGVGRFQRPERVRRPGGPGHASCQPRLQERRQRTR